MKRARPVQRFAVTLLLAGFAGGACGKGSPAEPPEPAVDAAARDGDGADAGPASTPQRPPRGQEALEAWLAAGYYRSWHCEAGISAPRLTGNHGRHRICSNDLLWGSASGPYPVGAASVKELFGPSDEPNGFAVGLKTEDGEGPQTWYWYERRGTVATVRPLAQGNGVPDCAVCHGMAARDNVFFAAP